jgi:hypothetical protein
MLGVAPATSTSHHTAKVVSSAPRLRPVNSTLSPPSVVVRAKDGVGVNNVGFNALIVKVLVSSAVVVMVIK